jgi:phosphoenolpyruvate-protein phosphotransferase (PTS system enzyme I)
VTAAGSKPPSRTRVFKGIGASPGVAIGRIFLLDRRQVRVPRYHVEPDQVEYEINRLKAAIAKSVQQLEAIRGRFRGEGVDHQAILEAHEMMLGDQALLAEAEQLIRDELRNAEWAVNKVIGRLRSMFDRVSDAYFKDRRGDIDFVGDRIVRNLVGQVADVADIGRLDEGTVVVAHDLSPVDTALLSRHRVTAFVTEVGGKTSHTSIIARSQGVPAVVGVHGIFEAAGSGDSVLVDGLDGSVIVRPAPPQIERGRKRLARYQRINLDLLEARALPARTLDGIDYTIAGNIELPTEVPHVLDRGGEAIGLYRTEFMFIGRSEPPGEEDHYRTYCQIFDEIGTDREVTVRTLDLGGDKNFSGAYHDPEPNPALGLRAIRYCLQNPDTFRSQIAGLLRAGTRGKLRIMLPMISVIDELRRAREIIAQVSERLSAEGKEHRKDIPIGIMIEVPSAVLTADHLAREADFFAVGTNDLIQYLLAIDRTNDRVAYLYHPLHPAMLRTLDRITKAAKAQGIPVSVCGEMAGEPEHTPILVGFGMAQLSMNAGSIPQVKRLVRELAREDCEQLLVEALECTTALEVEELVRRFLEAKAPLASQMWGGEE